MATDQGVGGSNPLTHVYCKKKAGQIVLLFFLQRTYGSDSNGFGLHSVPVGAERMSAGHPAPSHARLLQEEGRKEKEMMIYALFSKLQQSEQQSEKEGWIDADDLERELGVNID